MTETEQLRNRIQELEALLGVGNDDVSRLLTVLDATRQQAEIIGFILRRAVATREAIYTVLFGCRPDCDQPDIKLIEVQIVKIKAALGKIGIKIVTEWGTGGWSIKAADKAKLRALMNGEVIPDNIRKQRIAFLEGA